jgi:hypothetical protein
MILTSLGYNPTAEVLVGESWDINSLVLANSKGLLKGLAAGFDASKEATREQVCQMLYNALNCDVVKYIPTLNMYQHEWNPALTPSAALAAYFGATKVTGILTENDAGIIDSSAAATTGKTKIGGVSYTGVTGAELLGQEVTCYVSANNTIIGSVTPTAKNTVVTTTTVMDNAKLLDYAEENDVEIEVGTVFVDISYTTADSYAMAATGTADVVDVDEIAVTDGQTLKLIDNDADDVAEYAILITPDVVNVTAVGTADSTGKIEYTFTDLSGNTIASLNNKNTTEALANGDVATVYYFNGKYQITKLTAIESKVSAFNYVTSKAIINGTAYAMSGLVTTVDGTNTLAAKFPAGSTNFNNTYLFYIYNNAVVAALTKTVAADPLNYAVILGTEYTAGGSLTPATAIAKMLFPDGTTALVNVSKVDGAPVEEADTDDAIDGITDGDWVTYTVDAAGKYLITTSTVTNIALNGNITKNGANLTSTVSNPVNALTVYVVKTGSTYTVYTGNTNVPNLTTVRGNAIVTGSTAVVTYVYVASGTGATSSNTETVLVLNLSPTYYPATSTTAAYYEYLVLKTNGTVDTVRCANSSTIDDIGIQVLTYTNGLVTARNMTVANTAEYTFNATDATNANDAAYGLVNLGGTYYTYSASTVVYVVNKTTGAVTTTTVEDCTFANGDVVTAAWTSSSTVLSAIYVLR